MDDETGNLKIVKQKVSEKNLPPNVDLLKLIYPHLVDAKTDYNKLSDEELEKQIPEIYDILKKGSEVARAAAAETMSEVKAAMKINYFDDAALIAEQAARFAEK